MVFVWFRDSYNLCLAPCLRKSLLVDYPTEEAGKPQFGPGTHVLQQFRENIIIAVPDFIFSKAVSSSDTWNGSALSLSCPVIFWRQNCLHSFLTWRWWPISRGILATRTKWVATAFAETAGRAWVAGFWAAPRRRIRPQHLPLERVKSMFAVVSSQRLQLAAFSDSIRWSAMSGSPETSYSQAVPDTPHLSMVCRSVYDHVGWTWWLLWKWHLETYDMLCRLGWSVKGW